MVKQNLREFKREWRVRAAQKQSRSDWATTDVTLKGEKKHKVTAEDALSPGSLVKLALGERFKSVDVT